MFLSFSYVFKENLSISQKGIQHAGAEMAEFIFRERSDLQE
jgi:hypothetical protein